MLYYFPFWLQYYFGIVDTFSCDDHLWCCFKMIWKARGGGWVGGYFKCLTEAISNHLWFPLVVSGSSLPPNSGAFGVRNALNPVSEFIPKLSICIPWIFAAHLRLDKYMILVRIDTVFFFNLLLSFLVRILFWKSYWCYYTSTFSWPAVQR